MNRIIDFKNVMICNHEKTLIWLLVKRINNNEFEALVCNLNDNTDDAKQLKKLLDFNNKDIFLNMKVREDPWKKRHKKHH